MFNSVIIYLIIYVCLAANTVAIYS